MDKSFNSCWSRRVSKKFCKPYVLFKIQSALFLDARILLHQLLIRYYQIARNQPHIERHNGAALGTITHPSTVAYYVLLSHHSANSTVYERWCNLLHKAIPPHVRAKQAPHRITELWACEVEWKLDTMSSTSAHSPVWARNGHSHAGRR